MSKAVEIINAVLSPANKLIDAITSAIGKAYEPTHIKRMAKARAYEIEEVGRALRENADIPIEYSKGEIVADTKDFDEFVKRTQSRMAYQELQKQQNIESVADKAYGLLSEETECSDESVDNDWLSRFFNSVENISDSDMQLLWAKILAGEIKQPKTYSLRTLETLKNLSKAEALLFQKMATYMFTFNSGIYIPSDMSLLNKFGIRYSDIILLNECGLLTSINFMSVKMSLNEYVEQDAIYTEKRIMLFEGKKSKDIDVKIGIYALTTAGRELFNIVAKEFNNEYILDLAENIFDKYKRDVNIKVFEVNYIENGMVNYEDIPIKEFVS